MLFKMRRFQTGHKNSTVKSEIDRGYPIIREKKLTKLTSDGT